MKRTVKGALVALSAIGLLAGATTSAQERSKHVLHDAAIGRIKPCQDYRSGCCVRRSTDYQDYAVFSSGTLKAAEAALRLGIDRGEQAFFDESSLVAASSSGGGQVRNTIGCSTRTSSGDVRVNQDCTYRPQAEKKIVYNPANPSHLIAGENDARVGFKQCSIAWSLLNQNIVTSHYQPLVFPCEYRIRCSARP